MPVSTLMDDEPDILNTATPLFPAPEQSEKIVDLFTSHVETNLDNSDALKNNLRSIIIWLVRTVYFHQILRITVKFKSEYLVILTICFSTKVT